MIRPFPLFAVLLTAVFLAVPASARACIEPEGASRTAREVMRRVNAERATHGLAPLAGDRRLAAAAAAQACWMARTAKLSHAGPGGKRVGDRAKAAGYRWRFMAENVAMGYRNAQTVVAGWMASKSHRQNILDPRAKEAAVALVRGGDGRLWWALEMGAPK